ncbi:hypothetical protein Pcinc_038813 [Petrolisthes cinctipes]|uniref:NADP-dependent oxidoreductase domain-containing protein n=1 Tax=Petrolisthes cinctipes TaxID=88211 RepID=A0AAE1EK24_PETCI|nr:hypothetical protein Pcinc_038813 [Petrolisthes cinctipes]
MSQPTTSTNPATYTLGFHDPEAVSKMTYHALGNTGLKVSRFSLGGGPLGGLYGKDTEQERVDMVHLALKSGINYIDTAPWYGNGRSEQLLGKVGGAEGREERPTQLQLLGLDYVDVIQVHDLEFAESVDIILKETLPALQKVVQEGKARFIGITGYNVSLLKEVVERSPVKIDVVLTYARNTLIDDTLTHFIPFFKSRGIGVVNACAVSMGLLCEGPLVDWHPALQEIKDACKAAVEYCKPH